MLQIVAMSHAAVPFRMLEIGLLLGADRVRRPSGRESAIAETIVEPASIEEIAELVRKCESDRIALAAFGAGRTLAELRRRPAELGISLKRMASVVAYEPGDMTVVSLAGMTVGGINRLTASRRQRLGIDPPNPDITTLGAAIGAAHAGPLRHSEGLVRDLLIGIQFVGHGGRVVRAGGRVVKNVAGYDLMKLLTGSFGTLGIVTEATFKVRPLPENYALITAPCVAIAPAFAAAARLHDALPLLHLEVLSAGFGEQFGYPRNCLLLAGIGGNDEEMRHQRAKIAELLASVHEVLEDARADEAYRRLRDIDLPAATFKARVSVRPAATGRCLEAMEASLRDRSGRLEFRAHAGAGVAQISVACDLNAQDASRLLVRWRSIVREAGGHLRLTAVATALRATLPPFDQPSEGEMKLMKRLKASFDPAGVFNPRSFVGGI
jgi:glycolate oxidase FAD binding subunit